MDNLEHKKMNSSGTEATSILQPHLAIHDNSFKNDRM